MNKEKFCLDIDGNKVFAGDKVEYYPLVGCRGGMKIGVVKCIADMNKEQTNMPYIEGKGARDPNSIRKVNEG